MPTCRRSPRVNGNGIAATIVSTRRTLREYVGTVITIMVPVMDVGGNLGYTEVSMLSWNIQIKARKRLPPLEEALGLRGGIPMQGSCHRLR